MPGLTLGIVASPSAPHQVKTAIALAAGLAAHGDRGELRHTRRDLPPCDAVACWGWRKGAELRAAGHEVLVLERGYIGDRFAYTSLGWNGLNGRADFRLYNVNCDTGARFAGLFPDLLKPWKKWAYDTAVIMGQVPGDAALAGRDLAPWYRAAAAHLAPRYKRVLFRPHPQAAHRTLGPALPAGVGTVPESLDETLAMADLVVTFNSNSAVDAVLAGVPATAFDPGSMAWPVAGHGLTSTPLHIDRAPWAERLAHCQWTLAEIAAGAPWARLRGYLLQRKAA